MYINILNFLAIKEIRLNQNCSNKCLILNPIHFFEIKFTAFTSKSKLFKQLYNFEPHPFLFFEIKLTVLRLIPLFHTCPEFHELTRIGKYLDSWLNRTQFVMVLTDLHSP